MKILQFLGSLVPTFQRDQLESQLNDLRDALVNETLPVYRTAVEDGVSFQSAAAKSYNQAFRRDVDTQFRGEALEVTLQCLTNLQANLTVLESLLEKNFSKDIVVAGLTYKKAAVLQLVMQYEFGVDYARQVLLYLLAAEANVKAKTLPAGQERPKPEIKWLQDNQKAFFEVLRVMSFRSDELNKALVAIPEMVVNADTYEGVEATQGINKLDPLKLGFIPVGNFNPFYWFGIRYANWQVARRNRAKAEKRALEMRLEQLRLQRRGTEDAKLEKLIGFYEDEVNKCAAKIAKYEA